MNLSLIIYPLILGIILPLFSRGQTKKPTFLPVKTAVIGLVHTHVHGILNPENQEGIDIIAIVEPNRSLAKQYAEQYGFSMSIVYPDIESMLAATQPELVTAFNTIYGHLEVVEKCAPKGIHVMVEKPLAISSEHAKKMAELAREYEVHLLTNYETTWYGSNHYAYKGTVDEGMIGEVRKIVVHDGHPGPIEIGCPPEFVEWLCKPEWNGGGAITDFGCYGANLSTWLMKGEKPQAVLAMTQQIKPDIYPEVDDEATIILTYPKAQAIIQASWNWPVNRKDLHVYGKTGYIHTIDGRRVRVRLSEADPEKEIMAPERPKPFHNPYTYMAAVVRGKVDPKGSLSSLENNLIVMEILDAARASAKTGQLIPIE
ncbi:MAG: Gfo/Idh/MocA family oxidoreductase [Bacteroidota bacterium]